MKKLLLSAIAASLLLSFSARAEGDTAADAKATAADAKMDAKADGAKAKHKAKHGGKKAKAKMDKAADSATK